VENKKTKVFVGVSGGVDSSVALVLLKKAGYNVTGVFLKVWHPDFLPCDWKEERRSAMRVCATLGVPFLTMDCEAEYKKEVVDYMIAEYRAGRTPNPDVFCNKYVKFGVFLRKAISLGADFVATGHYSQIKKNSDSLLKKSEFFELNEALDGNKDQSYFLYTLNQKQLSRTLFPVGNLRKPEVRKLAEKFGLSTATKKDSQGVCFLENIDIKDFLSRFIKTKKGDVLNTRGEKVGWHNGAMLYTIGERHGFIITKKSPSDSRLFVVAKDLKKNTITVADKKTESDAVYSAKEIIVKNLHFISEKEIENFDCSVRIRYRQ
jgi:tRNA-specific 2-thiouridylase